MPATSRPRQLCLAARWRRYRRGVPPPEVKPGDLIFHDGTPHAMSIAATCGQLLRAGSRPHARWNHVMAVTDRDGAAAHATGRHVIKQPKALDDLCGKTYAIVHFECSDETRAYTAAHCEHLCEERVPPFARRTAQLEARALDTPRFTLLGRLLRRWSVNGLPGSRHHPARHHR